MRREAYCEVLETALSALLGISAAIILSIVVSLNALSRLRTASTQENLTYQVGAEREFLSDFEKKYPDSDYEIYDAGDLSAEMLENRNGRRIVERCIGVVTDSKTGDGMILNTDSDNRYISYKRISGLEDGTVVVSYMVYGVTDNSVDGIEERYDYVVPWEGR